MRSLPLLAVLALAASNAPAQDDVLLRAMRDEMERTPSLAIAGGARPYYIEYALHDFDQVSTSATLGGLLYSRRVRTRLPVLDIRVGGYDFDNTNFVAARYYTGARYDVDEFPLDDAYPVLRQQLWLATDMAYKGALEGYSLKRAALRNVTQSEVLADFWKAEPVEMLLDTRIRALDEKPWASRTRSLSALFTAYPALLASSVSASVTRGSFYLVTSEGTRVRIPETSVSIVARATAQAPDGMTLHDAVAFHSLDPDRVATDPEMERGARQMAEDLSSLVKAPPGEAYSGPVLFEGIAAPQLFAGLLGRNLAVSRRPVPLPGRTAPFLASELENRAGSRILPEWMDVVDDPSQQEWHGRRLFGHYDLDLEGVKPERVALVEKGVLKSFLLTRQPLKGFAKSNGHARLPGPFGAKAAGIGNLFVRASGGVTAAQLRAKLLDLCRERGKPYGLIVRRLDFPSTASPEEVRRLLSAAAQSGGTARPVSPPVMVFRLYPDGREELVRGLRFRGLDTRSLKDIVAAGDEDFLFDYDDSLAPLALMGASGFVSETSVVAPPVLLEDVELEPGQEDLPKPPLVPPPALSFLGPKSPAVLAACLSEQWAF